MTLQDRYLILGVVGSGGMGSVYKSRDMRFPNVTRLVAIKEVISTTSDPNLYRVVVKNFEREANLLATLTHPAIPRIYDYFTIGSNAYLVMDFIDGKNLEILLNESSGFMPHEQVLEWAVTLCDVLSYLHQHQPEAVIFRDIKPSNIMIDQRNHLRLIDFGIARAFETGEKGTMIGTEGYSPPEQYRGEASPQGDIYALGATLHHLLTRRDPRNEAPFSFAERPISKLNPSVPPALEAVISKALSYEPDKRFESAEAMRQALLDLNSRVRLAAGVTNDQPVATTSEVRELWSFECEDEVRGTPLVARGSLFVGCYDNNLYALDAETGEFRWKYATEGGIPTRPAYKDNVVFVASEDHRLYALTADTGKLIWTYSADGPIRSSPVVYEGHLFFGSDDGNLHVINVLSGRRAWCASAAGPVRSTPALADGCVYFGAESGHLYCSDFRGESKWRFRAKRAITGSAVVHDGVVYVGSMDSTLYALVAEAGWEVWRFRLGKPTISTPALINNRLITGCADGNVYAIDSRSSREVWRFETNHQVNGSPLVHEDAVYIGSVDGTMYCLDHATGRKHWEFPTGGPIVSTAAVAGDKLYFGSNDRRIYALLLQ